MYDEQEGEMMERLTKYVTPVGMVMTSLNSMKHYMPCVPCRHRAEIKYKDGKGYTEEFSFCGTCEVKMLFNKLKEYEDLEEQGLLIRLPCKLGDDLYWISSEDDDGNPIPTIKKEEQGIKNILINEDGIFVNTQDYFPDPCDKLGERYALLSREEAEQKLKEMK